MLALLLILATWSAGCAAAAETGVITTGADGLRTFTWPSGVLCTAARAINPVTGTLRGGQGAPEPVWLEAEDGSRLSVVWPAGFGVRFQPAAELHNQRGERVARDGALVRLGQVGTESAAGTFDDPFVASGLALGGCYPYLGVR